MVNVVETLPKHLAILREKHSITIFEAISNNENSSGQSLNQETNLTRPGYTSWSTHYDSLVRLVVMLNMKLLSH